MKRYDLFRGYEKTYINQEVKIFCNNLLDNKEYKGLFPRINKEIENYIKKTGDQIKRISNVKATMTDWQTHTKDGNNSDGLPIDLPIFPKQGDMFIFSSAIRHSVPPIYNQKERIIVAGNFWYNFKKQLKNYERKK